MLCLPQAPAPALSRDLEVAANKVLSLIQVKSLYLVQWGQGRLSEVTGLVVKDF